MRYQVLLLFCALICACSGEKKQVAAYLQTVDQMEDRIVSAAAPAQEASGVLTELRQISQQFRYDPLAPLPPDPDFDSALTKIEEARSALLAVQEELGKQQPPESAAALHSMMKRMVEMQMEGADNISAQIETGQRVLAIMKRMQLSQDDFEAGKIEIQDLVPRNQADQERANQLAEEGTVLNDKINAERSRLKQEFEL